MQVSYFGTGKPYLYRTDGTTGRQIYFANVTKCEPAGGDIIHESELSPVRNVVEKGRFLEIEIVQNTFKNITPYDKDDYNAFVDEFYKQEVFLKLHDEMNFIEKYNSADSARFYVKDVIPKPLMALDSRDIIIIRLESLDECKIPVMSRPLYNEDGTILYNEDGNKLEGE